MPSPDERDRRPALGDPGSSAGSGGPGGWGGAARPGGPAGGRRDWPVGGAERVVGSGRIIAGRYRLDRVLGKGSMGTVWAAYDETLHRRVAIKEIYVPDGTSAPEAAMLVERTLREARAIAQLSHPNVITLYDILTLNTGPVIVMEVLAARSLGEVLKEVGPLSVGQAATVGLAVAAGLAAAHAAGITHRDVKPGNVLIGGDGRIKLTDFGIARSAAENPMTATGLLLGSPAYIAPEVASGVTAGPPADAWGLGALLFACMEGKPPFDKGSPIATLMSVVNDPVPPLQRAGAITPVIKGLLVKEPAHRLNLRQARGALRPLADDPVETRLVFNPGPSSTNPGRPAAPLNGSIRPDSGLVGPRRDVGGPPGITGRPGGTGSVQPAGSGSVRPSGTGSVRPAGMGSVRPPPTAPIPPPWINDAPPRVTGPTSTRYSGTGQLPRPIAAAAASSVPPPPWAGSGSQALAPLPVAAEKSGTGSALAVSVRPAPSTRVWIAVVIFLAAAVLSFFGIRAIAESVGTTSSPVAASTSDSALSVESAALHQVARHTTRLSVGAPWIGSDE